MESWRAAFWLPTYPSEAEGIASLQTEAGRVGADGLINVICSKGCWIRFRRLARGSPALLVRGRLEASEGVINVIAEKLDALPIDAALRSRDFR